MKYIKKIIFLFLSIMILCGHLQPTVSCMAQADTGTNHPTGSYRVITNLSKTFDAGGTVTLNFIYMGDGTNSSKGTIILNQSNEYEAIGELVSGEYRIDYSYDGIGDNTVLIERRMITINDGEMSDIILYIGTVAEVNEMAGYDADHAQTASQMMEYIDQYSLYTEKEESDGDLTEASDESSPTYVNPTTGMGPDIEEKKSNETVKQETDTEVLPVEIPTSYSGNNNQNHVSASYGSVLTAIKNKISRDEKLFIGLGCVVIALFFVILIQFLAEKPKRKKFQQVSDPEVAKTDGTDQYYDTSQEEE